MRGIIATVAILATSLATIYGSLILPVIPPLNLGTVFTAVGQLQGSSATVPTTANGVTTAVLQLFYSLPQTVQANIIAQVALAQKASGGKLTFDDAWAAALNGVYLANNYNGNTNSVGGLSLPTYTLCQLGLQYEYTSCIVCNQDCYVAHNLWGGNCGKSVITGNNTCLCAESAQEAADRGLDVSSNTACKTNVLTSGLESYVIALVFRARYLAVQCLPQLDGSYDATGCAIDCKQNHGFASGACEIQVPNVAMPTGIYTAGNDKPNVFCVCSHDQNANTTWNADVPQPTNIVQDLTAYYSSQGY